MQRSETRSVGSENRAFWRSTTHFVMARGKVKSYDELEYRRLVKEVVRAR